MGYNCSGNGSLKLNNYGKKHIDELQHVLDCSVYGDNFDYGYEIEDNKSLYLGQSWSNYYDTEVIAFLKEAHPYIKTGKTLDYKGEDDCYWRFVRSPKGRAEQSGYIRYNRKKGTLYE